MERGAQRADRAVEDLRQRMAGSGRRRAFHDCSRRKRADVLGNGASILLPDVLWSELNVDHRGLNLCMPHELHQRRAG